MKSWNILHTEEVRKGDLKAVIDVIFKNRGIEKKEQKSFLESDLGQYSCIDVGIDEKELKKFIETIAKVIADGEKIIIFGDYDVDGICASAILWETIYSKTQNVYPYIPDRVDEGYGLSIKGVENVLLEHPDVSIIITVDNGIVAFDAVAYAREKGIKVIVTDHHVKGKKLPDAHCIIHTTTLCGAGIAWFLAKELKFETEDKIEEKLSLASLATVADLVPLLGANRAIVKRGIELLRLSVRPGIVALLLDAGVDRSLVGVHTIGYVIAPRLNATGRIQSAMNALRLLCTKNTKKAQDLASMLSGVNRQRQGLTDESVAHAKLLAIERSVSGPVIVVAHENYNQGVIGLIASQLVEGYYKPSFAIAKGEKISKGSARSIKGVNIIELLRSVDATLLEAGGHPMAAGFSLETTRIEEFISALSIKAAEIITDDILERKITIDMLLPFESITKDLVFQISLLEPFGMANPEPVFATKQVTLLEVRKIGREQNHLKLKVESDRRVFDAVGFGMAEKVDISEGDFISIAYTVDENEWNGKKSLQLKIKDILTQ